MGVGDAPTAAFDEQVLRVMPLGAGREVGRSCVIVQVSGKTIMMDCGVHPAYRGVAAMPFFDLVDLDKIDIVLISHFHLDHIGTLPFLTEKTSFTGKVYMTGATKAIGALLIRDLIRLGTASSEDVMYNERDLATCLDRVKIIDFHVPIIVDGIKITAYHAGHVLGGAMFLIEVGGVKVMYTGDYSREEDRHLPAAEVPPATPDVLICESTYGKQSHEPRFEREDRFTKLIHDIIMRDGRVLLPVFSSGRAQELLLILDEYWERHPEVQKIPVYYASALADKSVQYYKQFSSMMNAKVRKDFLVHNPFNFRHISNLRSIDHFDDIGPCVMMASPGMLQSGMSRELFERWCSDKRNGVIIAGYSVEGTLAKTILSNPPDIISMSGRKLPLRMSVDYISFSAHVDYDQNAAFIKEVNPPHLVLVHGEEHEMNGLKNAIEKEFEIMGRSTVIHTPRNCETVELKFKGERTAKIVGELAADIELAIATGKPNLDLQGILITKSFQSEIVAKTDLSEFSALATSQVTQRLVARLERSQFERFCATLERVLEDVERISGGEGGVRVHDSITVTTFGEEDGVVIEWPGDPFLDMVVDSIVALALRLERHAISKREKGGSTEVKSEA